MGLAKHSIEVERFSGSRVRGLLGREVGRTAKQNALAEHGLDRYIEGSGWNREAECFSRTRVSGMYRKRGGWNREAECFSRTRVSGMYRKRGR
jgi:hypothetical protein